MFNEKNEKNIKKDKKLEFGQHLYHFLFTFSLMDLGFAFTPQVKNNQSYTLSREIVDTGSMKI